MMNHLRNAAQSALPLGFLLATSCAGSGFWSDRSDDLADIFTFTVEENFGVKAQAGPLGAGAIWAADSAGLQGGAVTTATQTKYFPASGQQELTFTGLGMREFAPNNSKARLRGKDYEAQGFFLWYAEDSSNDLYLPYFTQFEVAAGVVGGVRIGFNPGELLDLLVGFAGLDLYADDLHATSDRRAVIRFVDAEGNPARGSGVYLLEENRRSGGLGSDEQGLGLSWILEQEEVRVTLPAGYEVQPNPGFRYLEPPDERHQVGMLRRDADELVVVVPARSNSSSDR